MRTLKKEAENISGQKMKFQLRFYS